MDLCSAILEPAWGHVGRFQPSWSHPGFMLGDLGASWSPLGAILGPSYSHVGPSWGHVGPMLGHRGAMSGLGWAILGLILAHFEAMLGQGVPPIFFFDLCCFCRRAKNTVNYAFFFDEAWSAAGGGSRIAKASGLRPGALVHRACWPDLRG